ncbi:MAG: NADH-quinone oxidoreductase subunit J [Euryarchaeota archaeon]|nr:NADH-quinone oxidoreductase subunit J [Euryarchaeota archaeon]
MFEEAVFAVLAAIILGAAVMVLRSRDLIHATFWLSMTLIGVAGLYLSLSAEFLAVVQVLVYVGAVVTLILFTILLISPEEAEMEAKETPTERLPPPAAGAKVPLPEEPL